MGFRASPAAHNTKRYGSMLVHKIRSSSIVESSRTLTICNPPKRPQSTRHVYMTCHAVQHPCALYRFRMILRAHPPHLYYTIIFPSFEPHRSLLLCLPLPFPPNTTPSHAILAAATANKPNTYCCTQALAIDVYESCSIVFSVPTGSPLALPHRRSRTVLFRTTKYGKAHRCGTCTT